MQSESCQNPKHVPLYPFVFGIEIHNIKSYILFLLKVLNRVLWPLTTALLLPKTKNVHLSYKKRDECFAS